MTRLPAEVEARAWRAYFSRHVLKSASVRIREIGTREVHVFDALGAYDRTYLAD